jgi:trehalose 2-sulfotransferase
VTDPVQTGSYLICATPRTGSTLLCGLLAATGIAGKPESYFRLQGEPLYAESWAVPMGKDGPLDYLDYVRAAKVAGTTANGVFAARVMWETMGELFAKLRSARPDLLGPDREVLEQVFGPTRLVHLLRGDVVAQAVSWALAEQTGYWHDEGGTAPPRRQPQFDFDEVDGRVKTIAEHNASWRKWFASYDIGPLLVRYEDLVADMAGTTALILGFLGLRLPPGHVIAPGTRRLADEVNRD